MNIDRYSRRFYRRPVPPSPLTIALLVFVGAVIAAGAFAAVGLLVR